MLVLTDLDGTLLNSDHELSLKDWETLERLGAKGIKRAIITGRSLYSAKKVLEKDFPVDFLVSSSGAGIFKWPEEKLLFSSSLSAEQIIYIRNLLEKYNFDYMVHKPVPENYQFTWFRKNALNSDFSTRLEWYKDNAAEGQKTDKFLKACQVVAILQPEKDIPEVFKSSELPERGINVIRTTSPLDHCSIWLEFFPADVSKGKAAVFLKKQCSVKKEFIVSIGNDFNDIDMLNWTCHSFIMGNAHEDLKKKYSVVSDNNSSGFTEAVNIFLNKVRIL